MDRRADGRAAGLQLIHADQRVPATPSAAATARMKRVGRLIPGRHAAAVSLSTETPRLSGRPTSGTSTSPTTVSLLPPALPVPPQPIPAHARLWPAPHGRQVSARCRTAPSRERRRWGRGLGGAAARVRRVRRRWDCGRRGKTTVGQGKGSGTIQTSSALCRQTQISSCCKNGQNILGTRSWHPKGKP